MMTCTVTSVSDTTVYENVRSILLPARSGEMEILPGHAELFAVLQKGVIVIRRLNQPDERVESADGECFFKENSAVIIV